MPTISLDNFKFSSKIEFKMINDLVVGQPNHLEIQVSETATRK